MTKIKRLGVIILLAFLIGFLSILLMGNTNNTYISTGTLVAYADEVDSDDGSHGQEEDDADKDVPVEVGVMATVKEWITVGFTGADFILVLVIIVQNAIKAKQAIDVVVNDSKTQKQLDELHVQTQRLNQLCMNMITIEHGTFEFLKELFACNPNIPEKSQTVIKALSANSDAILKDVQDLFSSETRETIKDALTRIGNITLG